MDEKRIKQAEDNFKGYLQEGKIKKDLANESVDLWNLSEKFSRKFKSS